MCTLAQTQVASNDLEGAKSTYKDILTDLPDLECARNGLLALAPASCTEADSYLENGAVKLAEDTYGKILEDQPREVCALDGLEKVALKICALGDLQVSSGQMDAAKATYDEVIKSYPNLECAVNGQAALLTTPAKIRSLVQLGNYEGAWTDLQTALKANPQDEELQNLAKEPWVYVYGIKAFFTSFIGKLITVVVIVIIGALFFAFSRKPKLDIGTIDATIVEEDKKASLQNEIQARFEQAIGKQGQLRKFKNPDLIDGPLDDLSLPELGLPEYVNNVMGFVMKLLKPNLVTINGCLAADTQKGVGIIIRLTQSGNKKLWGVDSVWESDVIPGFDLETQKKEQVGDRYKALVKYAAVLAHWLYYQHIEPSGLCHAFGTDKVFSHILTRSATALQEKEPKNKFVEMMLRRALVEDSDNYVAMLHLGKFILRDDPQESNMILERVESMTQAHKGLMGLPHIYVTYRLGASQLECYASDPKKNVGDLDGAWRRLKTALDDAQKIKKDNPEITGELVNMIRIAYADALRFRDPNDPIPLEIITEIEKETFAAPRVLYNLACHYSTCDSTSDATPESHGKELDKALGYLERALIVEPVYFSNAEEDPSFIPLRDGVKKEEYIRRIRNRFGNQGSATPPKPEETK